MSLSLADLRLAYYSDQAGVPSGVSLTDAEQAFLTSVVAGLDGSSISDLERAYYIQELSGGGSGPTAPAIVLTADDLGTPDTGIIPSDLTLTFRRMTGIASLTVETTGPIDGGELVWETAPWWPATFSHPANLEVYGADTLAVGVYDSAELYIFRSSSPGSGSVTIYWADAGDDIGAG